MLLLTSLEKLLTSVEKTFSPASSNGLILFYYINVFFEKKCGKALIPTSWSATVIATQQQQFPFLSLSFCNLAHGKYFYINFYILIIYTWLRCRCLILHTQPLDTAQLETPKSSLQTNTNLLHKAHPTPNYT